MVDEVGDEGGKAPVVGAVLEEVGQGHGAVREAIIFFVGEIFDFQVESFDFFLFREDAKRHHHPLSLSLSRHQYQNYSPVHEEGLEDALGVVERPVPESKLLHLRLGRDSSRRTSSPPRGRRGRPRVDGFREEVDESVDESRAEVLPEEDGRVPDLRAQVLEGQLGPVADAELGELLASGGERGGLALARLQGEREALPRRIVLGLGSCEGGPEVVDGGLEGREGRERGERGGERKKEFW